MVLVQVGWLVGAACVLALAVLVDGARARHRTPLGPAGRITLLRAVLACVVAGLTANAFVSRDHTVLLVGLASVALALDAVDGIVARRTGTATALGARFDMEVDAFLIAVLSVRVAPDVGWWVLAIGAIRYMYVAVTWVVRWLRRPLPPRYSAKVVAAVQGVVLVVAASGLLPVDLARVALGVALALLVESFARDVRTLWARRGEPLPAVDPATTPSGPMLRPAIVTGAAFVALWLALALPDPTDGVAPLDLLVVPVEGLGLAAAALVLPARPRRWVALGFGAVAGVLVVLRIVDAGFAKVLDRPFDPLGDWSYFGSGVGVLGDSIGTAGARLAAVGVVAAIVAVVVALALGADRVARVASERRRPTLRTLAVLVPLWAVAAVASVHVPGGPPVAAAAPSALLADTVERVSDDIADRSRFAAEIEADDYADVPADRLLTGLRGRDVLLVFVESYGRTATRGSSYSDGVREVLRDGTRRLAASGYAMRSGYLTSPTFGAASWLAHATTQSGLWVDSERRYDQLADSDRLTLTSAFAEAGWRTVFDVPANTRDWPEGTDLYGYDALYDSRNVGYEGPEFGYAPVPDQYTLEHFRRTELAGHDRPPVFAEIDLISSHHPWTPSPPLVPWDEVGDGSIFHGTTEGVPEVDEALDPERVRELYGRSIEYSWETLVSFLEAYPDPDRVLIVLGDHEPHAYVSGDDPGHDVPISVITRDRGVVRRIAGWGWDRGLLPSDDAPVWPMSDLRDRVLGAFGPLG
ncbi:phosphatidylglycerophosphate synthase [Nocardioides thalensis]|uniref:Phosphatidylglycerophosphate synthase n=1 Tax=Nocardioides thalensis TaxID=1914755 RepID=A0A853BWH6_9ACTN|nr:CDP-alcohol phosphatidyltransferase family protein [Nocardioides thalensis]NYI99330.1 phosphatidylglycerophosphate synthase [Nocardioides thalensis]